MNGTITERVIRTVAAANGVETVELPPLYDAIDPDALTAAVTTVSSGEVSFLYAGQEVTVTSDGAVSLADRPVGHATTEAAVSDD